MPHNPSLVCKDCGEPTFGQFLFCRTCRRRHTRGHSYRLFYKIADADYQRLYARQDGCCALCRRPFDLYKLHVDHDHETGAVRGLLCHRCNTGLGSLGDTIESAERAVAYLKRRPAL
jgi:Recombination endonuclease VII